MKRIVLSIAGALALVSPAPAQDTGLTGAAVLERCTSGASAESGWCVGFIYGVGSLVADGSIKEGLRACPPADFDSETARLLVVGALRNTEALRDLPGVYAVWYAFRKEFPCKPS